MTFTMVASLNTGVTLHFPCVRKKQKTHLLKVFVPEASF